MHCMMCASGAVNTVGLFRPFYDSCIHFHSFIHAACMYIINDALYIFVFNYDSPVVINDWLFQTRLQSL